MNDEADDLQEAVWLFAQECTFLRGVPTIKDLPPVTHFPEIAFAGRSNVGKSSLINALTGRSSLARTSNTPGRTQHLNFFQLYDRLIFVDMPGYGYAEAPKKLVAQWHTLIRHYLLGRPTLKRVYVLIDSRHGVKKNDLEMMKMLDETAVSYQLVLTKSDKIKDAEMISRLSETKALTMQHPAAFPDVILTSSEKKIGIDALRTAITTLCKQGV
jgi:GTP-binding protein